MSRVSLTTIMGRVRATLPTDSEVQVVAQPQRAETVISDTTDRRLLRWGVTLHRRSGSGDGDGWHLVLPGPDGTTDDVVVPPAPSRGGKVPAELSALVTALRRGAPLQPVAVPTHAAAR